MTQEDFVSIAGLEFEKTLVSNPKIQELIKSFEANTLLCIQPDDSLEWLEFMEELKRVSGEHFEVVMINQNYGYIVPNNPEEFRLF